MSTSPHPPPTGAASAAAAFLRGIERRAAVFAQWQCGDIDLGDAALARAMAAFVAIAPTTAFAEWPRRFWSQLLAAPGLRSPEPLGPGSDGLPALQALAGGPRVTVLLRLVAGLTEHEAATVLGVSRATYRLGLQRALPHLADGTPDAEAWRALASSVQAEVRALPPDRLARLAGLREAALRGDVLPPRRFPLAAAATLAAEPVADHVARRPRWLWPALAAVLVAMLAGLAWTWRDAVLAGADGDTPIRIEPLAERGPPPGRYDPDTGLLTEPDLELLMAPDDGAAWRMDPAFFAWFAAQDGLGAPDEAAGSDADAVEPNDGAPETSDAEF
ncbi:hypothetical protein [Luteimonas deserti]|uniref:RNA polymerase sigma factor 70 region 4 type 2 domain-containing protein n=1 Tax=Luteimonas deserti TaxID=2752306 RepID=A0A7Z0QPG0_9GAMM|nr:hypothetical protein [Luteimonas deserti]NYZ62293.1 hypothetical protein [Luteimonas deserti]